MNRKKTKNKKFLFFLLSITLLYCNSTARRGLNYFSGDFICSTSPGWGNDTNRYLDFLVKWSQFRLIYSSENKKIIKAKIVMVGDSLIHFFPADIISDEFPNLDIINRGIGGDTTYLLKERLFDNVISLKPEIILLQIGGNDLIQGKCLSYIENNYSEIIQMIRISLPNTKIIIISIPPTGVPELNSIVPVLNIALLQHTKSDKNIEFIDVWSEMRDKDKPTIKMDYSREGDKIHFNEKGYRIWAKILKSYLK